MRGRFLQVLLGAKVFQLSLTLQIVLDTPKQAGSWLVAFGAQGLD